MAKAKTRWIENEAVTAAKLNASVTGDGISGGGGSALTLDINGIATAETVIADTDLIAIYDVTATDIRKMTHANMVSKFVKYKLPYIISSWLPTSNNDVNIRSPLSEVDGNVTTPCMRVTGNAVTQSGGAEYFFVSDGRTPASVTFRYKVVAGATIDLFIFDVTNATADASTTGLSSTSFADGSISSGIGGTYTAGLKFRVRAEAKVDSSEVAFLGDVIITY